MTWKSGDNTVVCLKVFIILFIAALFLRTYVMAQEKEVAKACVLPFRVYSSKPMDNLGKDLQKSFTEQLATKGLYMVKPDVVNSHPKASSPFLKQGEIITICNDLKVDWLVMGSLTVVGEKVSIDLKVIDSKGAKPPFPIFMVEDSVNRLNTIPARTSTSIYNHVIGVEQIDSIKVEGNRRIEGDAIKVIMESQKGKSLDKETLDRDLRAIFKMGFFQDVSIETEQGPSGKIVIIKVIEKPSITEITFKGNQKIKEDDLMEELGIRKYSILNLTEVKNSINRLTEFYHKKYYYNIKIMEEIEELPNNEVALRYNINEGKKTYIYEIEFIGNEKYDDDDLEDLMETSEKGIFSIITESGKLDRKLLEFDVQKIVAFYSNNGYIKAKTGEPEISYNEDTGIRITIEIIEGPQYNVGDVKIEGDLIISMEELLGRLTINKEEFFNREAIRNDMSMLTDLYSSEGYVYVDIAPLTRENEKDKIIDITYNISKKARVRIERINIKGNSRTRDKVIRRELPLFEGEYFNGSGLRDGTGNLYRLGFFENVEVQTNKGSQDDLMILDINVTERPTGSFSVGAGYDSWNGIVGSLQIQENNLFGRGQNLTGSASFGERSTEFDVKFTEPWLFDKPLSGGIDLFNWTNDYDEYSKHSVGGGLRLGFPIRLDRFTRGSVNYAYADSDVYNVDADASESIKESEGTTISSGITFGIRRSSIDTPLYTTRGSINSLSFQYTGRILGGDVSYNKYIARSAWFLSIWKKTVIMIQGRLGYMEERSGGIVPVYDKFYLGGIRTVRGYDYRSISPIDPLTGDKIGGEKMWVYNLEYRFPLLQKQGVSGVIFYDAGNVFTAEEDFSLDGRMSYGGGFRWMSPIGLIRLEYGRKIDPQPGESSGEWEFSMGGTF